MKKRYFFGSMVILLLIECMIILIFSNRRLDISLDSISVNEVVTENFYSLTSHQNNTKLDYAVLDSLEQVIYQTKDGITDNVHDAIIHRDTILDIKDLDKVIGKVIFFNTSYQQILEEQHNMHILLCICIVLQCGIMLGYGFYLHHLIFTPFYQLTGFAERVARGELDIPLDMDRYHLFGAFSESFDLMRSELKKARLQAALAELNKKELVAKLSHDIKTPVASIKAASEVGYEVSKDSKQKEYFTQIIGKADQINTMVSNLFSSTLEELQQLTVTCNFFVSSEVLKLLKQADYLRRAKLPILPDCLVYIDLLRLQQVLDNIFANSYKYANTDILVESCLIDNYLQISIEDFGGGVREEEIPILKEKYKRGSNAKHIDGVGLGLYISDYFMKEMKGNIKISNGNPGLKIILFISLSGK